MNSYQFMTDWRFPGTYVGLLAIGLILIKLSVRLQPKGIWLLGGSIYFAALAVSPLIFKNELPLYFGVRAALPSLILYVGLGTIVFWGMVVPRVTRNSLYDLGWRRTSAGNMALGVTIGVALAGPMGMFRMWGWEAHSGLAHAGLGPLAVLVLSTTAGGAVQEEVVYRGFLFHLLAQRRLPVALVVVVQAVLFALAHYLVGVVFTILFVGGPVGLLGPILKTFQSSLPSMSRFLLIGLIFGLLRERSGSLLPSCIGIAHAINNAMAAVRSFS